jgi:hypothetical protein
MGFMIFNGVKIYNRGVNSNFKSSISDEGTKG